MMSQVVSSSHLISSTWSELRKTKMRSSTLGSQIFFPRCTDLTSPNPNPIANHSSLIPIIKFNTKSYLKRPLRICKSQQSPSRIRAKFTRRAQETPAKISQIQVFTNGNSRFLLVGAVSVGIALLFMGMDDQKALAFGPEGPLVEEFWENVRRYALYALTVSTGALYTILLPIFELLKNPISAILLLVILGGSIFIFSQVLSAMVGVTEFSYDYGY